MKQSDVDLLKSLLIKKSKMKSENGVLEIDNTADGLKARMISIEANKLYQDSREGYNLLKNELNSQTINGVEIIVYDDGSFSLDGTSTGAITLLYTTKTIKLLGDYIFYLYGKTSDKAINLQGVENSSNFTYILSSSNSEYLNKNYTEETELTQLFSYIPTGATFENDTFKPMISKETEIKEFQKYGQKPSLEEESEIEGITGDINIKNKNANYLDESKLVEKTTLGIKTKRENGKITLNGTGTVSQAFIVNQLPITLEKGTYYLNYFGKNKLPYFTLRNSEGNWIKDLISPEYPNNNNNIEVTEKTNYIIAIHASGKNTYTPEDTCFTLMISKKNDEKYTEYQSQTHTISLDSKIMYGNENTRDGIVLKNGKWNWKNLWKKEVFDGVNNKLELIASSNVNKIFTSSLRNNIKTPSNNSTISTIKCNYLKATSFTDLSNDAKEGLAVRADKLICFAFNLESVTDLNAANSKLQELNASGDPLYVLYELAEPEYEEITNEILISQLNKLLYQLEEYDDKTYISSDREIEFEMLIEQDKLRILESGGNIYE